MAEQHAPALVFIHGATGSALNWNYQIVYFRRLGYKVIAVDLPGHGRRGGQGYRQINPYAEFVESLLREESIEHPVLCGHSMGGAICLHLAIHNPQAYSGLVLAGTGARLRVRPALMELLKTDLASAVDGLVGQVYSSSLSQADQERAVRQVRKLDPETLYGDFLACDCFDVMRELHCITMPALVVVGCGDTVAPPEYSEYLHANLPDSRLTIIERAGHMVMIEQWREFNSVLQGFLKDLRAAEGQL